MIPGLILAGACLSGCVCADFFKKYRKSLQEKDGNLALAFFLLSIALVIGFCLKVNSLN